MYCYLIVSGLPLVPSWPGSPSACLSVFLLFSLLCNCVWLLIKYNTIQIFGEVTGNSVAVSFYLDTVY